MKQEVGDINKIAAELKAQKESEQNKGSNNGATATAQPLSPPASGDDKNNPPSPTPPQASNDDEVINKWLAKEFEGKINSPSELKALLTKAEPTEEDKKQLDRIREQAVMNEFLASHSKEDYDTIIKKSSMTDMDLVYGDFLDEYKDVIGDLDEAKKKALFEKKYNLVKEKRVKREDGKVVFKDASEDDVEEEEVTDENLDKLSKERLKRAAKRIREKLKSPIFQAESNLKNKFAQTEEEKKWQAEVEQTFPTLNLGKYKFSFGEEYGDVEYDVPKEILDEVKDEVKNPKKFASLFIDDTTKKTDKQKLAMLLLKSKLLDKFAFSLYKDGDTNGVKKGSALLPNAPDFSNLGGNAGGGESKEEKLRKSAKTVISSNPTFKNVAFANPNA